MNKYLIQLSLCLFLWLATLPATAQTLAQDQTAAVILAYHRIGEDEYPETNIRREQFDAQIKELTSGDYHVMALPDIIKALQNGDPLPPRTVALTFDGGHKSVLTYAVPLLRKNNLPFTVFIATDHAARNSDEYMNWDDLKSLSYDKLATIGLHPSSYTRIYDRPDAEISRQINTAVATYREQLGAEPKLFAYPFGEYSAAYRDIVTKQGFEAAMGQESGVAYAGADLYSLPRFTMTENYGDLDRFRLTVNALPIPVTDIEPKDPVLHEKHPMIGFTVDKGLKDRLRKLSCFVSGQGKPDIEIVGEDRVELRLQKDFEAERVRINCTLPVPMGETYEDPRWRWFGMLLVPPKDDGAEQAAN